MRWWNEQVVPRVTDLLLGAGEIHKLRERVCAGLEGEVLEIGFGSGLNIEHYPPAVERVSGVEPSDVAWQHRLTPVQRRLAAGCHLDRPLADAVSRSGLVIEDLDTFYLPGPKVFGRIYLGRAVKP